ncbi:MAG: ATP-binding protein [Calditrichaceae bacterium]
MNRVAEKRFILNLRIRPRMITGFLLMSGLLIVLGILANFYTNRMQQATSKILAENVSSLKAAEELEIALLDMKGHTSYYLLDGDLSWLDVFDDKKSSFMEWFTTARNLTHTKDEENILNEIEVLLKTYTDYQNQVVIHYQMNNPAFAHKILIGPMKSYFDLIFDKCEELLFINEKLMYNTSMLIERDNKTVNTIMYGMGILGILIGVGLGGFLARSITHPIYELVLKVKGATDTDIVEKVNVSEGTELDHLDNSVRSLINKVYQINTDLVKSRAMLERSERFAALGKISAGLAHEIRNPLTAIKMLVFSMKDEMRNDTTINRDFQVILKEILRMEHFLQEFLDFARPPKPEFANVTVNEIIEQTLKLMNTQLKNANIALSAENTDTDVNVFVDKQQMRQVFLNIIQNAVSAMPDGGKLFLGTKIKHDDVSGDEIVEIKIADNGKGISNDLIETIFDPFVTSREDGTGLGLSIAHQIITNHGGRIEAANNAESGALFTIILPYGRVKS